MSQERTMGQRLGIIAVALLFSPLFLIGHVGAVLCVAVEVGWWHGRAKAWGWIDRVSPPARKKP